MGIFLSKNDPYQSCTLRGLGKLITIQNNPEIRPKNQILPVSSSHFGRNYFIVPNENFFQNDDATVFVYNSPLKHSNILEFLLKKSDSWEKQLYANTNIYMQRTKNVQKSKILYTQRRQNDDNNSSRKANLLQLNNYFVHRQPGFFVQKK